MPSGASFVLRTFSNVARSSEMSVQCWNKNTRGDDWPSLLRALLAETAAPEEMLDERLHLNLLKSSCLQGIAGERELQEECHVVS